MLFATLQDLVRARQVIESGSALRSHASVLGDMQLLLLLQLQALSVPWLDLFFLAVAFYPIA